MRIIRNEISIADRSGPGWTTSAGGSCSAAANDEGAGEGEMFVEEREGKVRRWR